MVEGTTRAMNALKRKAKPDMPIAARIFTTAIGVLLAVCGVIAIFAVRPLNWESVGAGIAAGGLAADLLSGAVRGKWPESAFIWLDFPIGR